MPKILIIEDDGDIAAIGRDYRACAAVLEEHLAEEIRQRLEEQQQQ